MTTHECGCSFFGPGPHSVDARHRNARGCEHAEDGLREARLWQLALAKSIQGAGITDDAEAAWTMAANVKGQLDSRGVALAVHEDEQAIFAAARAALGTAQEKGEAGS